MKTKDYNKTVTEYHQKFFNQLDIDQVEKSLKGIAKEFRWYAAKRIMNDYTFSIWCYHHSMKTDFDRGAFTEEERETIEKAIRHEAYAQMDWGRKKNTNLGSNSLHAHMRTKTRHSGKWLSYDYFADYVLLFSQSERKFVFDLGKGRRLLDFKIVKGTHIELELNYQFGNIHYFGKDDPVMIRKSEIKFPGNIIKWNEGEKAFEHKGDFYHVSSLWIPDYEVKRFKEDIIHAFRKRRGLTKEHKAEKYVFENPEKVWVSVSDSLEAGNCGIGTADFLRYHNIDTGKIGGITAGKLFELAKNSFTIRAAVQAALRYM